MFKYYDGYDIMPDNDDPAPRAQASLYTTILVVRGGMEAMVEEHSTARVKVHQMVENALRREMRTFRMTT